MHGYSSIAEHDCKQQNDYVASNSSIPLTHRKLDNHWYIDSRAAKHMTFEKDLIVDFMKYEQATKIYLGQGKVRLSCYDESDVLYVPDLSKILISVSAIDTNGG